MHATWKLLDEWSEGFPRARKPRRHATHRLLLSPGHRCRYDPMAAAICYHRPALRRCPREAGNGWLVPVARTI